MEDLIIKGTGNSRYLKSVTNALTLYPTYESFIAALIAGNFPIDLNGVNPTGVEQAGTRFNKETLLKDETAQAAGLTTDAVPDDVLSHLIAKSKEIIPITRGGTGNTIGQAVSATSATQLATARTIRTNLASTSTASFNGTANITPGVTGTLPVANGGTGVTSLESLASAIVPMMSGTAKIQTGTVMPTSTRTNITTTFLAKFLIGLVRSSTSTGNANYTGNGIMVATPNKVFMYRGLSTIVYSLGDVTATETSFIINIAGSNTFFPFDYILFG